jgi:selenocysteine lyase/cysteine desulfurase
LISIDMIDLMSSRFATRMDAALWHGNQQEQLSLLFTGNGCERSNLIRLPENVVEHVADYVTLDRDDRAAAAAVVEIEQEERRLLAQEGSHRFPFASTTKTTFLNHGGCSGPCVGALALKRTVDEMANRQPMEWHRAVAPALVARAEDTVASYVGCRDPERLHFVENVSVGIFAALKACSLAPAAAPARGRGRPASDAQTPDTRPPVVVTTNVRYHSVDDALADLCERAGATLHTIKLSANWFESAATILTYLPHELDAAAKKGPVRLAVFDHVSSKPSVLFPVKRMVGICRAKGIPCLVDGAHAPGSLPDLDVDDIGADFYAVNFHKWLYAPRPSGALILGSRPLAPWIDASWFDTGSPSYRIDHLTRGLYDEATRDYANFIVLPLCVAIARRREPAFLAHRAKMLPKVLSNAPGLNSLALHWGSPPLVCENMCVSMASVFLPTDRLLSLVPAGPRGAINLRLKKLKTFVHDYLWNTHAIEVPCFAFDGRLCVRISLPEYVGEACLDRLRAGVDALLALADETRRRREANAQ